MKIDFSKNFGAITGGEDVRRYEQGGKYFDADGEEVVDGPFIPEVQDAPKQKKSKVEAQPVNAAEAAAGEELRKQLQG